MPASDCFNRCVKVRRIGGRVRICCRLGLWSVEAINLAAAELEARHYWAQYLQDGEYDELLSGNAALNVNQTREW